jgi:type III pantothenate kinase
MGGAIMPGMSISLDALASRTAKLPRIDISTPPRKAIGANTVDAIKSGLLFGYGAMVDGLIKKLSAEFTETPQVIATGGMSELIAPYTESIQSVDPMLTLKGLFILHEKNS